MGISSSKFVMDSEINGMDEIAVDVFEKMDISKTDLNLFYTAFKDMDSTSLAIIRIDELFSYFKLKHSAFNQKLFTSFDVSCDGYLNFCEFVACMWHFLSLDPMSEEFNRIVFELYGRNDGFINSIQLQSLLAGIHHSSNIRVSTMLDKFHNVKGAGNETDLYSFYVVVKETPSILAPVVSMQCSLRSQLVGISHWENICKERKSKEGNKCLANHLHRMQKYTSLLQNNLERQAFLRAKEEEMKREMEEQSKQSLTAQQAADKRRTSLMLGYYALKEAIPQKKPTKKKRGTKGTLPSTQRRRKSSIFRPVIVKKEKRNRTGERFPFETPKKISPEVDDAVRPFELEH